MNFSGTYKNRLDAKGRVSLPSEFRHALSESGSEKTVYVFPSPRGERLEALSPEHFAKICNDIEARAAMFSDEEDDLMAQIVSAARRLPVDGQGRILLPKDFVERASLDSLAVFVGFARRFVIFSDRAHKRWSDIRSRRHLQPLHPRPPLAPE